jgi:hypothetical protein
MSAVGSASRVSEFRFRSSKEHTVRRASQACGPRREAKGITECGTQGERESGVERAAFHTAPKPSPASGSASSIFSAFTSN